jgi:hypothetical protein
MAQKLGSRPSKKYSFFRLINILPLVSFILCEEQLGETPRTNSAAAAHQRHEDEEEEARRRRLYLNLGRPRPFYRRRNSSAAPATAESPPTIRNDDVRRCVEGSLKTDVRSLQEQGSTLFNVQLVDLDLSSNTTVRPF